MTKKEPVNKTVISVGSFFMDSGKAGPTYSEDVMYKDFLKPSGLPDVALTKEIVNEWAAWWHWNIDRLAKETKKKLKRQELPRVRMRCD